MQGYGNYHRELQNITENKIIECIRYWRKKGKYLSIRWIHNITRIEMKTLRKTLARLELVGILKEQHGTWHSKLYSLR